MDKPVAVTYEWLRDQPGFAEQVYHKDTKNEYFSTWCPWHDDREVPSLLVYPTGDITLVGGGRYGYWRCLAGCGTGGLDDLYRKVKDWERKGIGDRRKRSPSALAWRPPFLPVDRDSLTRKADTASAILAKYPELGWYIRDRGLGDRIEPRNLGYLDGWISIPVYNIEGEVVSLILRSTPPIQEATGLRFHSPSMPPQLYVPNWRSVLRARTVYVVFGMFDALSLDEVGLPVCCSTHGNQALFPTWFLGSALRDKEYLLVSDNKPHEVEDVKKRRDALRGAGINAKMHMIQTSLMGGCKDANDVLMKYGPDELRRRVVGVYG